MMWQWSVFFLDTQPSKRVPGPRHKDQRLVKLHIRRIAVSIRTQSRVCGNDDSRNLSPLSSTYIDYHPEQEIPEVDNEMFTAESREPAGRASD